MPTRSPGNTPSEARACAAAAASAWSWRNVSDSLPLKTAALSGTADSVCSNCAGIVVNCLAAAIGVARAGVQRAYDSAAVVAAPAAAKGPLECLEIELWSRLHIAETFSHNTGYRIKKKNHNFSLRPPEACSISFPRVADLAIRRHLEWRRPPACARWGLPRQYIDRTHFSLLDPLNHRSRIRFPPFFNSAPNDGDARW